MPDPTHPFDLGELYRSIDEQRSARHLTWAALAREVGVAASTIRNFDRAVDAEADGVLALIAWVGAIPEHFVGGNVVAGDPLPAADGGMVRVDMSRVSTAGRVGGRTSIQRLVLTAQATGQCVASLTRRIEL